jgi:hypothetical protein
MPHTATITLASGVTAKLEMPDLYAILSRVGHVPAPEVARVLQLLEGTGALEQQNIGQKMVGQANYWAGMYEVAALCMVEPRLVLRDTDQMGQPVERLPDDLTPRDVSLNDVQGIYYRFFLGAPAQIGHPKSDNPAGAARAAPDGDGLREAAE